ncbi:MAG: class I SAM-dependent methyltransferase [Chloroflexaceae bacterium]|nr:class I SAM-dependent methyltransferase [Chloroflexaceae bacterium]
MRRYGVASPRALLLGVTPEYAAMGWPAGTRLLAVDRNRAMIGHVWPKQGLPAGATVIRGEWARLPFPSACFDLVVGDGVTFAHGAKGLEREVARVLRLDGRYLLRAFIRPDQPESPDAVHADLEAGRIGSFHAYKWRLAMALHGTLDEGVRVADIWRAWRARVPDAAALARRMGWPPAVLATIDAYRDAAAVYAFPTLAELRLGLLADFDLLTIRFPGYELGERCPLVELRPRWRI